MSASPAESSHFGREVPLNGKVVPGLGVTEMDGVGVVRWHSHFLEFDYHQVVETEVHPEIPSIGIVRAYHIPESVGTQGANLTNTKIEGNQPMLFLLSKKQEQVVIITSRMNGEEEGEGLVVVRPPKYGCGGSEYTGPTRHVEMFDAQSALSEDELIKLHQRRIGYPWNRDFSFLEQHNVDELFLYMSYD